MRRFPFILPIATAAVMAAGAAQATAATLTLTATASPKLVGGHMTATIDTRFRYGRTGVEVDVFAAPAGSRCLATASAESKALGYPVLGQSALPIGNVVSSGTDGTPGGASGTFNSGSAKPAKYVFCGYLTHHGRTRARGTTELTLDAVNQVRTLYRQVLLAEYAGPAHALCSQLTPAGVKSFIAGGAKSCTAAFAQQQQVLMHKTADVDDSGYTLVQWDRLVGRVMAHLKVSVHGTRASAIGGESGIPGRTTLVLAPGGWLFSSAPPSIQP